MQNKPYNEWDNLFKNKFDNAEIEPSAKIWENIEANLPANNRRRIPIYWWAAASILIVSATLQVFNIYFNKELNDVGNIPNVAYHNKIKKNVSKADTSASLKIFAKKQQVEHSAFSRSAEVKYRKITKNRVLISYKKQKHLVQNQLNHHKINTEPIRKLELPSTDTLLVASLLSAKTTVDIIEVDSIAILNGVKVQASIPKKGIKNLGDLVNFLVNKIDKREKKLIKFDSNADNNSSIVALNIGFIQLNSKN